jgi:hypothetical protein
MREKVFVAALTNQDNPSTFGNQAAAARVAYPNQSNCNAINSGSKVARRPRVRRAIADELERLGLTQERVAREITEIVEHKHERITTTEHEALSKDGDTVTLTSTTKVTPSATETLKAAHMVNTLTGEYERIKNTGTVQRQAMIAHMRKAQGDVLSLAAKMRQEGTAEGVPTAALEDEYLRLTQDLATLKQQLAGRQAGAPADVQDAQEPVEGDSPQNLPSPPE